MGTILWRLDVNRLATGLTLIVLLVLAFGLARLTWFVVSPDPIVSQQPGQPEAAPARPGQEGPASPAPESVALLHLFGHADPADAPVAAEIDAPETRLRLQLRGVLAATPAGHGIALISDDSGNERHYLPGAEVPGGATVEQVHGDRVVLRREGRFELLRLPRDAPLSADAPPATPIASRVPAPAGGVLPEETRRQWLEDPVSLFDMVQVQPVMQDGAIRGFAISPRREARMFRDVGLRPGDVVTAINGISVAGMSDPAAVRAQLAGAHELRLDIERQGRPDTVVIPIGQ